MGTALPTVWFGTEDDFIIVHSAVLNWRDCLMRIKMPDAVLHILHLKGRIFAALANGCIAVFHRGKDGRWATSGYHLVKLGQTNSSVTNLTAVHDKIWVAYKNCVIILNPDSLVIEVSSSRNKSYQLPPFFRTRLSHIQEKTLKSGIWFGAQVEFGSRSD
jgi:hypothetical protein